MQNTNKKVILTPLLHKGKTCIALHFPYEATLQMAVRKTKHIKWSQTNKCWYLPLEKEYYNELKKNITPLAIIDNSALKTYLLNTGKKANIVSASTVRQKPASTQNSNNNIKPFASIQPVNSHVIPAMRQILILKAYSASTIKTYLNEMSQFLQAIKNADADSFATNRIKLYLQYCFEKLKLSENTLHSRMNALKFYYEQVLKKEKFFWEIPRPKKPLQLPKLLNETELTKLFNALTNKKHKAMLFTTYSAGLRVSEIVALKIKDIDSKRMQIFIKRAKGKKDRYVNLSPILLDILRSYIKEYTPKPKLYLFESEQTGTNYPTRTVQQIFNNAKHKAGIRKEVGVHSLRHSFATHLLDKGTDIRYIKDLLGHFNIKTTEKYLHVSKRQLVNITSPFDDLWKNEGIEW